MIINHKETRMVKDGEDNMNYNTLFKMLKQLHF